MVFDSPLVTSHHFQWMVLLTLFKYGKRQIFQNVSFWNACCFIGIVIQSIHCLVHPQWCMVIVFVQIRLPTHLEAIVRRHLRTIASHIECRFDRKSAKKGRESEKEKEIIAWNEHKTCLVCTVRIKDKWYMMHSSQPIARQWMWIEWLTKKIDVTSYKCAVLCIVLDSSPFEIRIFALHSAFAAQMQIYVVTWLLHENISNSPVFYTIEFTTCNAGRIQIVCILKPY